MSKLVAPGDVIPDYTTGNPFSVTQQYYDNTGAGGKHNIVSYAMSNNADRHRRLSGQDVHRQ